VLRHADHLLLVTTGGDGDVVVWQNSSQDPQGIEQRFWKQVQRLQFDTKLQHCGALCTLPSDMTCALLALGGVDGHVRVFVRDSQSVEFRQVCDMQGHQNWVRGLSFSARGQDLLLASASQDKYIRLWKISREGNEGECSDPTVASQVSLMRYAPRPKFEAAGYTFTATLEALLIGHEDWVHSVQWRPRQRSEDEEGRNGELCLLSASMDRTMMMWVRDQATGKTNNISHLLLYT